jgi:signal transduction histidine kinase/ABC-type amino acid transport substrate-binding protein
VVARFFRRSLAVCALVLWCGPAVVYGAPLQLSQAEQNWLKQHPRVRVRISPSYPPFEFLDQGKYQGLAYDYLMVVGQRLGIEFVPVPELNWTESLEGLRNRQQVDLILLITRTPEREPYMNFTRDYITFPWVIFSRKDGGFIGRLSDLGGKAVAVEQGYITAEWLKRDIKSVRLKEFPTSAEAIEAVALDRAEAYVGNLAIGTYLIEKKGLVNLKVAAPTPYGDDPLAMAVRKDWPELVSMIDRVLLELSPEEHQAIRQKWLSLRVEHGVRTADIVKWVLIVGVIALLWVLHLRRTVRNRTAQLSAEIRLRQEKELALENQSAQMSAIFDSLEALVYVVDMETMQLLYLNRYGRHVFGDDWASKPCFEFFQKGQSVQCPFCTNDKLVVAGVPQPAIVWEHHNEKSKRWYQCIDRAILWPDGRLVRMEIAIDITERKEIDQFKDEMLSVVGHEIRTPLAGIMGYSELMLDMDFPPEKQKEYLGIIYRESERLAELFDNFLSLQALKIANSTAHFLPISIHTVLEDSVALLRGASRSHRIQLDCLPELPMFKGDAEQMHRVFLNLISNAIKYSPGGGQVSIAAYRSDDNLVVRVTDEGIGIDLTAQERIFEPFYRIDNRDSRAVGGTGLGLSLVKETVSLHGGQVWVESQVGKGSSFFVSLPACEPVPQENASSQQA